MLWYPVYTKTAPSMKKERRFQTLKIHLIDDLQACSKLAFWYLPKSNFFKLADYFSYGAIYIKK